MLLNFFSCCSFGIRHDTIVQVQFVLASNNPHKLTEVQRILPDIKFLTPSDFGIKFAYHENGNTFDQNAVGKARHFFYQLIITRVDDYAGLCVASLKGANGLRSARFGPPGQRLNDLGRYKYLLSQLGNSTDRSATFVCCIAIILDRHRLVIIQDAVAGDITWHPRGTLGFGYDPVVCIPRLGKTMAELTAHEKDKISHRGRALRRAALFLNETSSY